MHRLAFLLFVFGTAYSATLPVEEPEHVIRFRGLVKQAEEKYGPNDPKVASRLRELGWIFNRMGRFKDAEPLFRRALTIHESKYGAADVQAAVVLEDLANVLFSTGRFQEAETLYLRAIRIQERTPQVYLDDIAKSMARVAAINRATGRTKEAEVWYRKTLKALEDAYGAKDSKLSSPLNGLAEMLFELERIDEAESLFRRAIENYEAAIARGKKLTEFMAVYHLNLGLLLCSKGAYAQAEPLFLQAEPHFRKFIESHTKVNGDTNFEATDDLDRLAKVLFVTGRFSEAELLLRRSLELRQQFSEPNDSRIACGQFNLAALLWVIDHKDEAKKLLRSSLELIRHSFGKEHPQTRLLEKLLKQWQRKD